MGITNLYCLPLEVLADLKKDTLDYYKIKCRKEFTYIFIDHIQYVEYDQYRDMIYDQQSE